MPARVVVDPAEAARLAAEGSPVVLVSKDPSALGAAVASAPDEVGRERWLAVMVGDPEDPTVIAAAQEMAAELWPWARTKAGAAGEAPSTAGATSATGAGSAGAGRGAGQPHDDA